MLKKTENKNKLDPKIFFLIFVGISAVIAFIIGGFYLGSNPDVDTDQVACTQDAKICPDGSAVGRQGPKCEFAPCPK